MRQVVPVKNKSFVSKQAKGQWDTEFKNKMLALKDVKKEFEDVENMIKDMLGSEPLDEGKGILGSFVQALVPNFILGRLPDSWREGVSERKDLFEFMEELQRDRINNVQIVVRDMAVCTQEKLEELERIETDIEKAEQEGWDAKDLQEYITENSGIELYDEVAHLLDKQFGAISDEKKEKYREFMLSKLRENSQNMKALVKVMGEGCFSGLTIFQAGVLQYYSYLQVYRPMQEIAKAAKGMTEMDTSIYAAKSAVQETFNTAIKAMEVSLEAADMVEHYSIASPEMEQAFIEGAKRLQRKLTEIENSHSALKGKQSSKVISLQKGEVVAVEEAKTEVVGETTELEAEKEKPE